MAKLQVYNKCCNLLIGDHTQVSFYQQNLQTSIHLIVRPEKKIEVLNFFIIKEQPEKKSKKFAPEIIVCKKCDEKIGSNASIGPEDRPVLCYKAEIIYFIETLPNGQTKRTNFDFRTKWKFEKDKFPIIELRNFETFEGNRKLQMLRRTDFIENVFPKREDLVNFNIALFVEDTPRTYQTELYVHALFDNSIVYLPTGSGKTMISAMVIAHMKRLNPKKKIFFVTDRIPLVFQQASYLRNQCNLTTGEFCGENKAIFESQLEADIYVLTAGFLLNMLLLDKLYLEDCSCLVFDEIHHAKNGHNFAKIIEHFYHKIPRTYKPRVIGMTASPASGAKTRNEMIEEIIRLSSLIEGSISMPVYYREDFEKFVNRPPMTFINAVKNPNEDYLIEKLNKFIEPFMHQLNTVIDFNSNINVKNNALRSYLTNLVKEHNIQTNLKKFTIGCFLQSIVGSVEIMKIFGITQAVQFLIETLTKEFDKNKKNRIWSEVDIRQMTEFLNSIQYLNGSSQKISVLKTLLKDPSNHKPDSRIIIFVQSRKTAKLLYECLKNDDEIKKIWKPKFCVGHASGNLDGMTWYEDQEPILNSFNEGQCKLLVATNVLQEGLDVQICDKVIIFDTLWNLTQYVQSRGRARHKDSQFIVIDTLKQKTVYDKLVESEKVLLNLIHQITHGYTSIDRNMVDNQINLIKQVVKTTPRNEFEKSTNKKLRFTIQVLLIDGLFVDVLNCLRQCKGFLQCDPVKDSLIATNYFDSLTDCCNCLFEIKGGKQKLDDTWLIFNTIKFILNSIRFKSVIHLFKMKKTQSSTNLQSISPRIEFGNLARPYEFYKNSSIDNCKFIIDFSMRLIKVLFISKGFLYKLEFQFDSIDHLISIQLDPEDFNVYIPFKRAPFIYIFNDETGKTKIDEGNLKNVDEEYLTWDRTFLETLDLSLKLKFSNTEKEHVIESLNSLHGIVLLYCNVANKERYYTVDNLRTDFKFTSFNTCYCLEAFISQNFYLLNGKISSNFVQKLNQLSNFQVEKALECLNARLNNKRFLNIEGLLDEVLADKTNFENKFELYENNLKISLFRRATVTPTRVIFYFPEPNFSNRVTRQFGSDNFIRIRFRDEDHRKLNMSQTYSDMKEIYSKIRMFLTGGVKLWGRQYQFLAMSSSQLRENGCWLFYGVQYKPDQVREWMGDFKNIRCIGKYAARLGQSLSSSIETFHTQNFCMIEDIKVDDYCFTDGIGKISFKKASEISLEFYNKSPPASAFQIRFAGFKGVVAIDPKLTGYELQFRDSMRKFESGYTRLDVLNLTEYIPCYLNRQIIIILSSLGIKDSVFDKLQDDMLRELSNLLIDKLTASLSIIKYYRCVFSDYKHNEKLDYTRESFFRDLLKTIYQKSLTDLVKKSRIFVQKGRILMGTIDETGILKENEVFVQCSKQFGENYPSDEVLEAKQNFIVNKKVVVAKNPCMHPGDVRVLNAVDIPELHHMIDCVVFPSVGPRPITNMCSGSDLDGDLYFVSWEPSLIPEQVETPMDYVSPKAKEKDSDIQIEDVIKFFVDFIEMDQLGRIANAHVALSDQSKHGVKDPVCIQLALAFSLAVDFPKTGVLAQLPSDIKKIKYPDFMEKNGVSYRSEKIIGKLYRKCKNIFINDNYKDKILLNQSLLVDGHEKFVPDAKELYAKYRNEIERIMQYFNCTQESELFVGIYLNSVNSDEARDFYKLSCSMIKKLWKFMRQKFHEILKQESSNDQDGTRLKIASSWYFACYSSEENKRLRILSFPWILEDVLTRIDVKNNDIFSQSVLEKFCENKNDLQLFSRFVEKIELKKDLEEMTDLNLVTTGSFGLFLFEDKNDLQLIVNNPNRKNLLTETVSDKLEEFFDNISFNNSVITCDESDDVTFTILDSQDSLKRFIYLRKSIFNSPELLPVFYFLVHFAREDNLFLSLSQDKIKLDLYLEFCLEYLISKDFVQRVSIDDTESVSDCLNEWTQVHDYLDELVSNHKIEKHCGKMILNFYQFMAFQNERLKFKDIELDEHVNEILKNHFYKVFNYVSKTLDVSQIWNSMGKLNEPVFRQRFSFAKKKGKSPNLFVDNASLLLFSNFKSDLDRVEFELYKGKRRFLHYNKECYLGKISRPLVDFTGECFSEFYHHSVIQFNKAKEMRSDYTFRLQLKFGDSYFTNVPTIFEDSSSIVLYQLKEALKKGYKKFNFSYNQCDNNMILSAADQLVQEDDETDIEINDSHDNNDKEKKKKKKKRRVINRANTSFDSNVRNEQSLLHSLFLSNEFDNKTSECYIIYVQLKNLESMRNNFYRLKYGPDMKLVRIETLPIKWLNIDIRNLCLEKDKRDVRFNLISEKTIQLDENDNIDTGLTSKLIQEGVIKVNQDDELVVVEEFRTSPSIFVRFGRSIKYYGGLENWKPLFDMTQVKMPENIQFGLLRNFRACLSNTEEYSEHDERGMFMTKANRSEVSISGKVDINSLKASEIHDLIILTWHLIQVFSRILK